MSVNKTAHKNLQGWQIRRYKYNTKIVERLENDSLQIVVIGSSKKPRKDTYNIDLWTEMMEYCEDKDLVIEALVFSIQLIMSFLDKFQDIHFKKKLKIKHWWALRATRGLYVLGCEPLL